MSNQNQSLSKKDLNQVAGGGLGASRMKTPSRGKPAKALFAQYQIYFNETLKSNNFPVTFEVWKAKIKPQT